VFADEVLLRRAAHRLREQNEGHKIGWQEFEGYSFLKAYNADANTQSLSNTKTWWWRNADIILVRYLRGRLQKR
jgi:hypothetical protein